MRRAGFLFIALFALLGCPSSDLSSTCHFQGETTTCGKCIQAACQSTIDSECDSIIRDDVTLGYLDKCGGGKDCSSLFAASYGGIGACAKAACESTCTTASISTKDAGTADRSACADYDACSCCAGTLSRCVCEAVGCWNRGVTDCECGGRDTLLVNDGQTRVDACTRGICCQSKSGTSCHCSTDSGFACVSTETSVDSCSADQLSGACPSGRTCQ